MGSERTYVGAQPMRAQSMRWLATCLVGVLALGASSCVGENPVEVDARVGVLALLGGLEVGEALTLEGRQAERIFLPGRGGGAEFVIVPFLGSEEEGSVTLGLESARLLHALRPPVGRLSEEELRLDRRSILEAEGATARFHERLRRSEIQRLGPGLRAGDGRLDDLGARRAAGAPRRVPVVGEILSLSAINDASANPCLAPLERGGRVAAVSQRAIMVSDTASPAELSDGQLQEIAEEFDALIHPVGVEHFGAPTDLDENDRVIIFFTPVVNEVPALGFFFAGDLFSQASCPASNESEILYILSPDPLGQTPVPVSTDVVGFIASDVIAHELQHLINASRRVYVNDATELEAVWLNEGLSHIAEEIVFYEETGFEPGSNLDLSDLLSVADLADKYMLGNTFFYASYAADPTQSSLTGSDNDATRGASWAFLRYAADREGRPDVEFFYELVNSTVSGLANLDAVLQTGEAVDLMQAWTASVFADDFTPGVPDFLTQPSWNFRSTIPALMDDGQFPLDPQVLESVGGQVEVTLDGGAAAFFYVRVDPGGMGDLRLDVDGPAAASLRVSVIRAR